MKEKFSTYLPGIVLFSIALVIGLIVFPTYGIGWDEASQKVLGTLSYNYAAHGDPAIFSSQDKNYGVGFELLLEVTEKWLNLTDTRDIFLMRHLVTHLLFLLGAFSFYVLVFKLYRNKFLAVLAFLMLYLSPRMFAHSFFNSKDLPFLSMFVITFTIAKFAFDKNRPWLFFLLGLAAGYATSIRVMGIMLLAFILIFLFMDLVLGKEKKTEPKKIYYNMLAYTSGFCIILYAAWPYLWPSPIYNFIESFTSFSHYNDWDFKVLLNGQFIPAKELPLTYFPIWFFITTPVLWLLTGFAGIVVIAWDFFKKPLLFLQNTNQRNFVLYLLCFTAPIFGVLILHSVIYDDWRHLYFTYPSFILVSIYFINKILNSVQNKYRIFVQSVCVAQLVLVAYFMVMNHPFQQVYFNELVSHENEYLRKNYELDYWGCSYKQGLEYVLAASKADTIKVATNLEAPLSYNLMILPEKDRQRIKMVNSQDADYFLTNFRGHPNDFNFSKKAHSFTVLNSTIFSIYPIDRNTEIMVARKYLQAKQFDSALVHLKKIQQTEDSYAPSRSTIAEIYANKQNFDSAEVYIKKAIELKPNDVDAMNNLGCIYMATKKFAPAIEEFKKAILLSPQNANAYSNLGHAYFFTDQYQAAIDNIRKEITLNPGNKADLPFMSASFQKLGKPDSVQKYNAMAK